MSLGVEAVLVEVTDLLARLDRPYAIAGGVAVAAWGVLRATRDVDIYLVLDDPEAQEEVRRGLEGLGYHVPAMREELERMGVCRSRSPGGVFLDLFNATGPLGDAVLARRRPILLGERRVSCIAPEELAVLKAFSDRPRDYEDLVALISVLGGLLDLNHVRDWARRLDEGIGTPEVTERLAKAIRESSKPGQAPAC